MSENESTSKRLLVVEDEKALGMALQRKLSKEGYVVDFATNGEEALAILADATYDLLIVDLMMPELDGFGLMQQLKDKGNTTPIVISTNLSQSVDEEKARELGAIDYFIKSDTPLSEVVARVTKLLQG